MAFTRLSSELTAKTGIELDNVFILELMPFAPENYTKVYIYGKMLAEGNAGADNSPDRMAKLLGMTEDDIMEAFRYWEEQGLVRISAVPPYEVEYKPAGYIRPSHKAFSKKKFTAFNEMLMRMFPNREFLPSELNEYYSVIEDYHIDTDAMLSIIAYCARLKGKSVGWKYIVTVARNLANEGCRTTDEVETKLSSYDIVSTDVAKLFKVLHIRRAQDFEDVRLYRKWTEEMGFSPAAVLAVAKGVYGEMKGLDTLLTRYHADGLIDLHDIEEYRENRANLLALTKELLAHLDVRYNHLDYYAETYVKEWLKMGFDASSLMLVADYCFRREKKSCEKMNALLKECADDGATSAEAVRARFVGENKSDASIAELLAKAGIRGDVTSRDRDSYNIWTNYWHVPKELLAFAAERSMGEANPRVRMHALVKLFHESGVTDLEGAKKLAGGKPATANIDAATLNDKIKNISTEDI